MADKTQSDVQLKKLDDQTVGIPEIYFNGFEVGITLSDINIITMTNGHRQCRLLMSFNTAKTLVENLKKAVDVLESHTKHTILKMEDVQEAIDRANKGPNT